MKKHILILLIITHSLIGILGFSAGIYVLPILTAPPAPSDEKIKLIFSQAQYTAQFRKDLKDSDMLHWGEGTVAIGSKSITLMGKLAPGPDYRLYLSPEYVETEVDFNRLKNSMVRVGDVKTFNNFIVKVPAGIDPSNYTSVIVWCEAFSQFITSASYHTL
jgi:hypothetical protein